MQFEFCVENIKLLEENLFTEQKGRDVMRISNREPSEAVL